LQIDKHYNLQKNYCPQVVTIGFFDGFHIGHQKVARTAQNLAEQHNYQRSAVTFEPVKQLNGMLTTTEEKLSLLEEAGFDRTIVMDSELSWKNWTPDFFIKNFLKEKLQARYVAVGKDFQFGKDREGNVETMKEYENNVFKVIPVPTAEFKGEKISSTRIRRLVSAGLMEEAEKLLGRKYFFTGVPQPGHQVGRKIGFPTVNYKVPEEKLMPRGVFLVSASGKSGLNEFGACFAGETKVEGVKKHFKAEVHFFNYKPGMEKNLNRVSFLKKVRDTLSFESLEELRLQIEQDIQKMKFDIQNSYK